MSPHSANMDTVCILPDTVFISAQPAPLKLHPLMQSASLNRLCLGSFRDDLFAVVLCR